jgi:hypothetical protein
MVVSDFFTARGATSARRAVLARLAGILHGSLGGIFRKCIFLLTKLPMLREWSTCVLHTVDVGRAADDGVEADAVAEELQRLPLSEDAGCRLQGWSVSGAQGSGSERVAIRRGCARRGAHVRGSGRKERERGGSRMRPTVGCNGKLLTSRYHQQVLRP